MLVSQVGESSVIKKIPVSLITVFPQGPCTSSMVQRGQRLSLLLTVELANV